MRVLTIFSAALALAVSVVNAAAITKRELTASTQACIGDLNKVNTRFATFDSTLQNFTGDQGYVGAFNVHHSEQDVETNLQSAINSCCSITTTISAEDSAAVVTSIDGIVPEIEQTLNDVITKKADLEVDLFWRNVIKNDICNNLKAKMNTLDACLVAFAPVEDATNIQNYVGRVNSAFTAVNDATFCTDITSTTI